MASTSRGVWFAGLLLASGCIVEGKVGRDEMAGEGSGGGTGVAGDDGADGADGAEGPVDGEGDKGGGGEGGESDGTAGRVDTGDDAQDAAEDDHTADDDAETTAGDDVPALCHPLPDDTACTECRKTNCCAALDACLHADACPCWWDCIQTGHEPPECERLCEGPLGGELYNELAHCELEFCRVCGD